jgi:metal-sulfur cluster biosynthetic enzyme
MKLNKKIVYQKLKTVMDPEIDADIISMGLIYDVKISQDKVYINMTLTNPACPFSAMFIENIREALFGLVADVDQDVIVDLTFDPPWTLDMMSPKLRKKLGFE